MAKDIHLTFDRPMVTKLLNRNLMELKVLKSGMRSLAPGRAFEFMIDTFINRDEKDDQYLVTVDYSSDGDPRRFHESPTSISAYGGIRLLFA